MAIALLVFFVLVAIAAPIFGADSRRTGDWVRPASFAPPRSPRRRRSGHTQPSLRRRGRQLGRR
ncbi:MAG TPA: hypothetical protein VIM10_15780 [Actinopolymorphaceae bacterium]